MTTPTQIHPRLQVVGHPLLAVHLTRLRDEATGHGAFRQTLDAAASFLVAAALADLSTEAVTVRTPLQAATGARLSRPVALVPILRAGLGMVDAALRLVPDAAVWHLGLYRDEATLEAVPYYNRLQPGQLAGCTVLVLDPMLATAGSAIAALGQLRLAGAADLRLVALVAAPEGLTHLATQAPEVPVTVAAVDERLSHTGDPWPAGYIMPGLGDAGDRQFGTH